MKRAYDFRAAARDALRGRWGIAVIAGLLASLLGAAASSGPEIKFNLNDSGADIQLMLGNREIYSSAGGIFPELDAILVSGMVYIVAAALVMAAVYFVLGSVISLGYSRFNLDLVDRRTEPQLVSLFSYFPNWKNAALTRLLQTLYIFLWSLLLVIPGIIAAYSYAMTSYILAENPELPPGEALRQSKEMMSGNRFRLFCLQFSFLGWDILSSLTLGIGSLWLTPYKQAATAAFFRDIPGREEARQPFGF